MTEGASLPEVSVTEKSYRAKTVLTKSPTLPSFIQHFSLNSQTLFPVRLGEGDRGRW